MKALLLSIFLITFFTSCNNQRKRPEPNFYRNLFTNETLSQSEYDSLRLSIVMENLDSLQQPHISFHHYNIEISNDSVIQPFAYSIRIGTEYLVRAREYEKMGMIISPEFFRTLNGDSIQIGGQQSKPMLINLWFVHCRGCIEEMPALNKLKEKYSDRVNFVAMTFENDKSVHDFLNKKEFNFIHITNNKEFIDYIGSYPYPENIFISSEGTIEFIEGGIGGNPDLEKATEHFDAIIKKLLLPTWYSQSRTCGSGFGGSIIP
jgi:thiol-disulfide isomerase/thioredoxin